ncbi:MAG: succinyl-diaminopimelate desuccinylase [Ramlibacter sp.]|nr:succinyl-diaminopimelate desuccinylase [Ramlibacter sp.]
MSRALHLTEQLISRRSVTPEDGHCQQIIAERLAPLGFACETILSGPDTFRVTNLWAKRAGALDSQGSGRTVVFAGHTDVVPTGPLSVDGTVVVCDRLKARGERLDYCIVGEPTSVERVGDMIKNGRRGTMSGKLSVKGVQGHIAYPQLAKNPIHLAMPALAELVAMEWDRGNDFFQPTSWQMSNIHAGTGAGNVIPGTVTVDFNFRYSTESTPEGLQKRLHEVLDRHGLDYQLDWVVGGLPFLTTPGGLVNAIQEAIRTETGIETELSTTGGTSDGRFISRICPQVIEFGPINASIHKIDEHVRVADIEPLKNIYRRTLENLEKSL